MVAISARVLDTAEYGRYTLALATTSLLVALSFQSLKQGINRFLP